MKRVFIVLITLVLVFQAFAEVTATLTDIKGKVEVKPNGGDWVTAKDGMKINILATISTGFDSTAVVKIDKTSIFVNSLTRMTLDKLMESSGKVNTSVFLRLGSVKASVKSAEGVKQDFKVQSPYSTASVRGTEFEFDGLIVSVTEGIVAVIPGRPTRDIQVETVKPAAPADETTPPADGTTPPADGTTPPADGTTPPADGTTPPADGTTPPTEGETPPAEGGTPPADVGQLPPTPEQPPAQPVDLDAMIANDFVGAPEPPATPQVAVPVTAGHTAVVQVSYTAAPPSPGQGVQSGQSVLQDETSINRPSNQPSAGASAATDTGSGAPPAPPPPPVIVKKTGGVKVTLINDLAKQ